MKACETARKKAAKARRQKGDDDFMAASLCWFWEGQGGGEVRVREVGKGSTLTKKTHIKPQWTTKQG